MIAAILDRQPDPIATLQPMTPAGLERICAGPVSPRRLAIAGSTRAISRVNLPGSRRRRSLARRRPCPAFAPPIPTRTMGFREVAGDGLRIRCRRCCVRVARGRPGLAVRSAGPRQRLLAVLYLTAVHVPLDPAGHLRSVMCWFLRTAGRWPSSGCAGGRPRRSLWKNSRSGSPMGAPTEIPNLDADARLFGWSRDGTEPAVRTARGIVAIPARRIDCPASRARGRLGGGAINTWGDGDVLFGTEAKGIRAISVPGTGSARDLPSRHGLETTVPARRTPLHLHVARGGAAQGNPTGCTSRAWMRPRLAG